MKKRTNGISPEKVRAARKACGLTQAEAAPLVYTSIDNWQNWEQGRTAMARAIYELFLLKTGQVSLVPTRAGLWSTS
jgi:DNA-binding transcriptional regulator YiaG